jgi:hypothetical protein
LAFSVIDVRRLWPEVIQEVKTKRRFTWTLLSQNARVVDLRNSTLSLAMADDDARDSFVRGGNEVVVREALDSVMDVDLEIETIVDPNRKFTVEDVRRLWPQILEEIKRNSRRRTWTLLNENAQVVELRNGILLLAMANDDARNDFAFDGASKRVLQKPIWVVLGADFALEATVDISDTTPTSQLKS